MIHQESPDNLPPVHSGELLADELKALDLSATKFATRIGVPTNAITEILKGERRITAKMALRLGKVFGTGERYWLNLQTNYDVKLARAELHDKVEEIVPLVAA